MSVSLPDVASGTAPANSPLAIGGVGGSGTRVVAAAAIALGFDMGNDFNKALDNLAFTLLFKDLSAPDLAQREFDRRVRLLAASATGSPLSGDDRASLVAIRTAGLGGRERMPYSAEWLGERASRLLAAASAPRERPVSWGWKEPNTHVVLPRLLESMPRMRYVHVVRNGLDMAFSSNYNQLMVWGPRLLGRPVQPVPRDALAYWCEVQRRAQLAGSKMGSRFLWFDHDALCMDPAAGMLRLVEFLGMPPSRVPGLVPLVKPQPTTGRHRAHGLDEFAPEDLAYLAEIGHL